VQVLGALSGAGHGAARELRQVQRNVDYPSARAVIQRALVDATGLRQLSAAQPSALRRAPAPAPPATPPGSADELLAAIYRSPADDELRLAYADRLSRAGDPRGELIALQLQPRLDPTRRRRVQQLLAAHARHWLGELRPALREEGLCYSRGFPVAGQLDLRTPEQAARLQGHPAWSTFESLELAGYCPSGFLTPAIFPALRELSGVGVELGLELCDAAEPWHLSSLQLARPLPFDEQRGHDLQQVAILARSRGLPELRHLGLPVAATGTEPPPAAFGWLFEGPLSSRLSHLTLQTAEPGPWLVRGLESGLLALELRSPGGEQSLELQRAEDGWSLAARFGALRRPLHGLATTLEPLPEGSLVGLTVTLPRGAVPEEAGLRRLQSQARRLGVPEPCLG
jgi:uncharacterized protein (TIGR02996 family)